MAFKPSPDDQAALYGTGNPYSYGNPLGFGFGDIPGLGGNIPPPPGSGGIPGVGGSGGVIQGGGGGGVVGVGGGVGVGPSYEAYLQVAQMFGEPFDNGRFASLVKNHITPQEYMDRLRNIQWVENNQTYFQQYNAVLRERGLKPLDKPDDVYNFAIGKLGKDYYDIWDEAATRGAAVSAGLYISDTGVGYTGNQKGAISREDLTLSPKDIKYIQGQTGMNGPGVDPTQLAQNFQQLAQVARTALPLSRWAGWKVTKRDLENMEFGGPGAYDTAVKVNRILASDQQARKTLSANPKRLASLGATSGASQ